MEMIKNIRKITEQEKKLSNFPQTFHIKKN